MRRCILIPDAATFWSMGDLRPDGCILWTGRIDAVGYGRMGTALTGTTHAHRSAWILTHGEIPGSLTVEHICHTGSDCTAGDACLHRRCINPRHLCLLPKGENSKRQHAFVKVTEKCPKGHDRRALPSGQRYCPVCLSAAMKAWRDKNGNRARENAKRQERRRTAA